MYLWLHIIVALAMIVLLIVDLRKENGSLPVAMTIRTLYLVMLADGIYLAFKAWHRAPVLVSFKIVASILVIGYIEYLMARRARNQLKQSDYYIAAGIIVLLVILGLFTAGFRPWIHL